jgi:hypothetical protein
MKDVMDNTLMERPIEGVAKVSNGTRDRRRTQKVTPVLRGSGWPLPRQQLDEGTMSELHLVLARNKA